MPVAQEYLDCPDLLQQIGVYDDGIVKEHLLKLER